MSEEQNDDEKSWLANLKYWASMGAVVFLLFFLFVMLAYGSYFSTDCDFVRFITFRC